MPILLVEDELAIQGLWADTLRDLGYVVDLAGTLGDAKACFAAQVHDLVITDWRLPDGGCRLGRASRWQNLGCQWVSVLHAWWCGARS